MFTNTKQKRRKQGTQGWESEAHISIPEPYELHYWVPPAAESSDVVVISEGKI
jgi:hypothetical protein